MIMLFFMFARVMAVLMSMMMLMRMSVTVFIMPMFVLVPMFMMVIVLQVNVEFRSLDIRLLAFRRVNVEFLQAQFVERLLQLPKVHS